MCIATEFSATQIDRTMFIPLGPQQSDDKKHALR